jgi:DNA modification methylase
MGAKKKDLLGIPWMVAFALRDDGWFLRSSIVWFKPGCKPESVDDRPTRSHELIFLLSKSPRYHYDLDAIREPPMPGSTRGRNRLDVWTVPLRPTRSGHKAPYQPGLVEPCVKAGSAPGDTVLDPFCGAGSTGLAAASLGRHFVGVDLDPRSLALAAGRLGLTGGGEKVTV